MFAKAEKAAIQLHFTRPKIAYGTHTPTKAGWPGRLRKAVETAHNGQCYRPNPTISAQLVRPQNTRTDLNRYGSTQAHRKVQVLLWPQQRAARILGESWPQEVMHQASPSVIGLHECVVSKLPRAMHVVSIHSTM